LLLFRNQPALAAQLMQDALGVRLPPFQGASIESADLTELQPAEYRADLVIRLSNHETVYAIIVEVQLSVDDRKRYAWPAYVANLRARLRCPVALLVVTTEESVARWAARRVELGGLYHFTPYVLGPSRVPEIVREDQARRNPELAVLSVMAHGRDTCLERAVEIAISAQNACHELDADRQKIYCDLILNALGEAAREALKKMDARTYEYQSDFARKYIAQGRAEGRVALLLRLLTSRFGAVATETETRIRTASIPELDRMGERILTARTMEEALGSLGSNG
jgi:hypothetical protein